MKVRFYKALPDSRWSLIETLKHHAITVVALCYQWLIVALHTLFTSRKPRKYQVSICMIFKNEAPFLKEWIEYHALIGVQHFYLYNNNSTDNFRDVLNPYITNGLVTLIDWPQSHAQLAAYQNCIDSFANDSQWIAFIDADEFINLQRHNSMTDMLRRFRHVPSLQMQWRDFGTSGHISQPADVLITEYFTAAWPWLCNQGKTIINTDYKFSTVFIHYCIARFLGLPLYPVNDLGLPAPYFSTLWPLGVGKTVYLNHYFSKSYEWYIYKDRKRGSAVAETNTQVRKNPARFRLHELNNFTRDYSVQRWLTMLKLRMNGNDQTL